MAANRSLLRLAETAPSALTPRSHIIKAAVSDESSVASPVLAEEAIDPEPIRQPPAVDLLGPSAEGKEVEKKMLQFSVKTAFVGSLGGLLFGYDLGVVASALPQLTRQFLLSTEEKELVVGILLAGCVVGAFLGGYATDKYGRKVTIMMTDGVFIVGALLIAVSSNFAAILVGRFIVGMGVSISAIADVAYLTEVAPSKWRGAIVSANELMISAGFMGANFIGWSFTEADKVRCCPCSLRAGEFSMLTDGEHCVAMPPGPAGCGSIPMYQGFYRPNTYNTSTEGWRYMFGFAAVIAVGQLIGMCSMPKSPRWLLLHGKYYDSLNVLKQIYITDAAAEAEIKVISAAAEKELDVLRNESLFETLRRWRAQLAVGVLLFFFAQMSGQSNVLSYAPEMFANAGMNHEDAAGMGVFIGIGKFLCTCICVWKVDEIPRRMLLIYGTIAMAAALLLLAFNFHGVEVHEQEVKDDVRLCENATSLLLQAVAEAERVKPNPYIGLVAMMTMAASYSVSFGPLGWLITSEMFSTGVRGRAIGVVTVGNWCFNLAVSGVFETMVSESSYTLTFMLYFFIMLLAIAFERAYVPETRHMEPEDVITNDIFECSKLPAQCLAGYSSKSRGAFERGAEDAKKEVLKKGTLRKLGGKNKDKWEERHFELTHEGLRWDTSVSFNDSSRQLTVAEMASVALWSDIGINHAFEICTKVKDDKVYKFSATDEAERDAWIAAIEAALGVPGTTTTTNDILLEAAAGGTQDMERGQAKEAPAPAPVLAPAEPSIPPPGAAAGDSPSTADTVLED